MAIQLFALAGKLESEDMYDKLCSVLFMRTIMLTITIIRMLIVNKMFVLPFWLKFSARSLLGCLSSKSS